MATAQISSVPWVRRKSRTARGTGLPYEIRNCQPKRGTEGQPRSRRECGPKACSENPTPDPVQERGTLAEGPRCWCPLMKAGEGRPKTERNAPGCLSPTPSHTSFT